MNKTNDIKNQTIDEFHDQDSNWTVNHEKSVLNETGRVLDEEVKLLIDNAYVQAVDIIRNHYDKFCAIAEALLVHETLTKEQLDRIMEGRDIELKIMDDVKEVDISKESDQDDLKDDQKVGEEV